MDVRTKIILVIGLAASIIFSWLNSDSLRDAIFMFTDFWLLALACALLKYGVQRLFKRETDIRFDIGWMTTVISVFGLQVGFSYYVYQVPMNWMDV